MLQAQNDAQGSEIKALTKRIERLESPRLPTPAFAAHVDRPSYLAAPIHQTRPSNAYEELTERAVIERGRLVRMRTAERAKEMWTGGRPSTAFETLSSAEEHGTDQGFERRYSPRRQTRRPSSPKPAVMKRSATSTFDVPPLPIRPQPII